MRSGRSSSGIASIFGGNRGGAARAAYHRSALSPPGPAARSPAMHRLLLVFADGVGLAPASLENPFASEPTPALRALLGGPLTRERLGGGDELALAALDACLGVPGLPQSGTGQTTLFTGVNAQAALGRHAASNCSGAQARDFARTRLASRGPTGRGAHLIAGLKSNEQPKETQVGRVIVMNRMRELALVLIGLSCLSKSAWSQPGTCKICVDMDACGFFTQGGADCIVRCSGGICNCAPIGTCGFGGGGREGDFGAVADPNGRVQRAIVATLFEIPPTASPLSDQVSQSLAVSLSAAVDEAIGSNARAQQLFGV